MSHDFTHEPFSFVIRVEGLPKNFRLKNFVKTKQRKQTKTAKNPVLLKTHSFFLISCSTQHI